MRYIKKICIFASLINILAVSIAISDECIQKRHVFELGSGTTRMTTYLLDVCQGNVIKHLSYLTKKMPYQHCLAKSQDKKIDEACIAKGVTAVNEMQKLSNIDCSKDMCTGFATAWAREASNTQEVIEQIAQKAHLKIYPISQDEEANIAYTVAQELLLQKGEIKYDSPDIVLLDIGGGSFQITTLDPQTKKRIIYKGNIGTETLTKEMRSLFPQKKSSLVECSALNSVYKFFDQKITATIKEDKVFASLIKKHPNLKLYGVGAAVLSGLHNEFEVQNPAKIKDLEKLIKDLCGMSFEKVATIYPKRKIEYMKTTNAMLFLLHSIMKAVGAEELYFAHGVNAGYYVAKRDEFWAHYKIDKE